MKSNEKTTNQQTPNIHDILNMYGIDKERIRQIYRIIGACESGKTLDSLEFKIIWDSHRLAQFQPTMKGNKAEKKENWKTDTGYQLAHERFEKWPPSVF